jgi:hypothetical protein
MSVALEVGKMGYPIHESEFFGTRNVRYYEFRVQFWVVFLKTQITWPKILGNHERPGWILMAEMGFLNQRFIFNYENPNLF